MCGIVGAIAQRDVAEILLEGLRRLEYRGYDSAGLAVVDAEGHMTACVASVKSRCWLRQRKNILCMAVRVLLILAGRPTVNLQK